MLTTVAATVAVSALTAGPALAHYCYKTDWNDAAAAAAARSGAWSTAGEMKGFVGSLVGAGEICEDGGAAAIEFIDSLPDNTLFMGPGLLAGGAVRQGKSPDNIGHLPLQDFFSLCGMPE